LLCCLKEAVEVRAAGQVPSSVCDAEEDFLILYNQNEEIASE
jgi:hypothetical protein